MAIIGCLRADVVLVRLRQRGRADLELVAHATDVEQNRCLGNFDHLASQAANHVTRPVLLT